MRSRMHCAKSKFNDTIQGNEDTRLDVEAANEELDVLYRHICLATATYAINLMSVEEDEMDTIMLQDAMDKNLTKLNLLIDDMEEENEEIALGLEDCMTVMTFAGAHATNDIRVAMERGMEEREARHLLSVLDNWIET